MLNVTKAKKLKAAAGDLSTQAKALHTNAGTLEQAPGLSSEHEAKAKVIVLKEAASGLKWLLDGLNSAKDFSEVVAKAQEVLAKYNEVVTEYGKVAEDPKAKAQTDAFDQVKSAFETLQAEFDKIILLTKAAGSRQDEGLRGLAQALYTQAEELHTKAGGDDSKSPKKEAKELKEAVGAGELSGLTQALKDLYEQGNEPGNLPTLAKAVKEQYKIVKAAYEAVVEQKTKYTDGNGQAQYTEVVKAWNAFNTAYKEALSYAPEYDVKGTSLGDRLKLKATELQIAAKALQAACGTESALSGLASHAGDLASSAQTLATDPSKASENATAVIEKYKLLEDAYNRLPPDVQAKVEKEFDAVKHIYDRILNVTKAKLLKAQVGEQTSGGKIWNRAKDLHEKADGLAGATKLQAPPSGADPHKDLRELAGALRDPVGDADQGLQKALSELSGATQPSEIVEKAKEVITKYKEVAEKYKAVVEKSAAYTKALSAEQNKYSQVQSAFDQLKGTYDKGQCKAITPIFDKPVIRFKE